MKNAKGDISVFWLTCHFLCTHCNTQELIDSVPWGRNKSSFIQFEYMSQKGFPIIKHKTFQEYEF